MDLKKKPQGQQNNSLGSVLLLVLCFSGIFLSYSIPSIFAQSQTNQWTDPTIGTSTPIKTTHIQEMRQRINTKRATAGLPAFVFTDPVLTAGAIPVRAKHFLELQQAIQQLYESDPLWKTWFLTTFGTTFLEINPYLGTTNYGNNELPGPVDKPIESGITTALRQAIELAGRCGDGVCQSSPNGPEACGLCDVDCNTPCNTTNSACGPQACGSAGICAAGQRCATTTCFCTTTYACVNDAACPTPSCTDGIKNGTETGIDCGGTCPACSSCTDGIKNGTETGVDCGGSCAACGFCLSLPVTILGSTPSNITGTSGPDVIRSATGSNIDGNDGDDFICAQPGSSISGGNGNDTLYIDGSGCNISGDGGNDHIIFLGNGSNIDGGPGTDICDITGSSAPSTNNVSNCECVIDGVQNGDETGVDCGGSCPACASTCSDGIKNGTETGVDCGGSCAACAPTCSDGIQNGTETGVDCGGSCAACAPTCSDGIKNGTETGVDCGGCCTVCPGATCLGNPVSIQGNCSGGNITGTSGGDVIEWSGGPTGIIGSGGSDFICSISATIIDGGMGNDTIFSGSSANIYGGGDNDHIIVSTSTALLDGGPGIDICDIRGGFALTILNCECLMDSIQNGDETGVDCGGSCPACGAPTCSDGIKNGTETGVDCGGTCPACASSCFDGIQNGTETGVDCGGSCAACGFCLSLPVTILASTPSNITGTSGPDVIRSATGSNIDGNDGDDFICASPGSNISGGNGNDTLYIDGSGCNISGDGGNDHIIFLGNGSNIDGGPGTDICDITGSSAPSTNNVSNCECVIDGVQNGDETGVDCGGSCPSC